MKKILLVGLLVMATSVLADNNKEGIAFGCGDRGCLVTCQGFEQIGGVTSMNIEPVADSFKYTLSKYQKYDQVLMVNSKLSCNIIGIEKQHYYKINK